MTADTNVPAAHAGDILTAFKQCLVDDGRRIDLHALVHAQTGQALERLAEERFPIESPPLPDDITFVYIAERIAQYEEAAKAMQAFFAFGCYFGNERQDRLWATSLQRIAAQRRVPWGESTLSALRLYPALLLLYTGGIAAVAQERYASLAALLLARVAADGENHPAAWSLAPDEVLDPGRAKKTFQSQSDQALQEHLFAALREPLGGCLPDGTEYMRCFDLFEYLLCLTYADICMKQGSAPPWPVGLFASRSWAGGRAVAQSPQAQVKQLALIHGSAWEPLRAGLFDGSLARLDEAGTAYGRFLQR